MKQKKVVCITKFCRRKPKHGKYCPTCQKRHWRDKNPMKDAYHNLKSNAKKRGKVFTISFEYFARFAFEEKLLLRRGRSKTSYSVDRIINELGYIEGNLQVLEKSANSSKGSKKLIPIMDEMGYPETFKYSTPSPVFVSTEEDPF
jgi:hypothetical protein